MWMFLLGLIIGILIMVLWFSYSQKRVDSSQLEKPKKDFSSPMLNQNADSHATADHRHDTHQPQAVRKSGSSSSDNGSDTTPPSAETAETASTTLSDAPESSAHSRTDTTAYAASTPEAANDQAVKVDNLGDHNAEENTDAGSADNADSSTDTNTTDGSTEANVDDQQNHIEPSDVTTPSADEADNYDANTDHGSTLASDDEEGTEAAPLATVDSTEDDHITADDDVDTDVEEAVDDQSTAAADDSNNDSDDSHTVDIEALMADLPKAETDADDLKQIKGVGPKLESMLNDLGISTFKQVASLNDRQCKEVSLAIKTFPDRIYRDQWVEQAKQFHDEKYS